MGQVPSRRFPAEDAAENLFAPVEQALYGEKYRRHHEQQRQHQKVRLHRAGTQLEQLPETREHNDQTHQHGAPHNPAERAEGLTHLKQHHHAHHSENARAHRGDGLRREVKNHHKRLTHQHGKHVGQPAGERPAQNAPEKMPGHPVVVRLHGEEERGNADGQRGDHG